MHSTMNIISFKKYLFLFTPKIFKHNDSYDLSPLRSRRIAGIAERRIAGIAGIAGIAWISGIAWIARIAERLMDG